jgi:hypothetical protein
MDHQVGVVGLVFQEQTVQGVVMAADGLEVRLQPWARGCYAAFSKPILLHRLHEE